MNINYEKNQIVVFDKSFKYDSLIKKIATLSGEQMYSFITSRGVLVPRKMNCLALTCVLNDKIKFLHSNSLSKDYFTRLCYYESFTETQLINLFKTIANTEEDFYKYKYAFCKLLIDNYIAFNISDGEINYLKNSKKGKSLGFEEYANYISAASLELDNTFDGQSIDLLKSELTHTATIAEIQGIGAKYGIDIPDTLTKEAYVDYMVYYMKRNNYIDYNIDELNNMTLAGLSQYAKKQGIPMQPSMSKDEVITYLFYYLEQCEIPVSHIDELLVGDEYWPLEFGVDLAQINPFGNNKVAKKLIHYANEADDEEEFNRMLEEVNAPKEEEIIVEPEVESLTQFVDLPNVSQAEIKPQSITGANESFSDYKEVLKKVMKESPIKDEPITEEAHEESQNLVNKILGDKKEEAELLASIPEKKDESNGLTDEERRQIDEFMKQENEKNKVEPEPDYSDVVYNTTKNDLYGSNKLLKYKKSKARFAWIYVFSLAGLAAGTLVVLKLLNVI